MRYELHEVTKKSLSKLSKMPLRGIDWKECQSTFSTPQKALRASMKASLPLMCKYGYDTKLDEVTFIFGVAPVTDEVGVPWLLCSPKFDPDREWAKRSYKEVVPEMQSLRPILYNQIHKENTVAIRWLEKLGFTMSESKGLPSGFLLFSWYRQNP